VQLIKFNNSGVKYKWKCISAAAVSFHGLMLNKGVIILSHLKKSHLHLKCIVFTDVQGKILSMVRMILVSNICGRNFDLPNDTASYVNDTPDGEDTCRELFTPCLPTCVEFRSQGLNVHD
jgi:hypothetical protein